MFNDLPIVGYPVKNRDIVNAIGSLRDPLVGKRFMTQVGLLAQARAAFMANSGSACFYIILKALQKMSPEKSEVILPAYTASSLVVAIKKAGLKPVLCDISLDDFNADPESVLGAVTPRTLLVLAVHMFGIPWLNIIKVKRQLPRGLVIVEDGAQAFGASINGLPVGLFGDAAFFSFNRGKNLPTLTGGVVTTYNPALAEYLRAQADEFLRSRSFLKEALAGMQCAALRLAFDPFWHSALSFLIARFKEARVPSDIALETFSRFQAGFGLSLLGRWEEASRKRFQNGCTLQKMLGAVEGVMVPKEEAGVRPAFNRMPIVFKKTAHVEEAMRLLKKAGIESSRMYGRPLHHILDCGYRRDDFPNAIFVARNLLTLPVHPLVREEHLKVMIDIVKKVAQS